MPETILVTGATGTVGSEVVKQLVSSSPDKNEIIIKAAIHSQNKDDNFKRYNESVQSVNLDYNKPETIADALNQVDKLFLLTSPSPDMTVYSNFVKEIRKYDSDINHIVKLSSMAANDDEEIGLATTIGRIHREEEEIIEESGIPFTSLRPTAFMQNFVTQFGYTIRTQDAFYIPAGDAKLSFIDAIMEFYSIIKAGHASNTTNVFEELMGRRPITFSQFARDYAQAFK